MTECLKLARDLRITGCLKIGIVLMDLVSFWFLLTPAAANPCCPSTDVDDLPPASRQSTIFYFLQGWRLGSNDRKEHRMYNSTPDFLARAAAATGFHPGPVRRGRGEIDTTVTSDPNLLV